MQFQNLVNSSPNDFQSFKIELLSKINNPQAKKYIQQQILSTLSYSSPIMHDYKRSINKQKSVDSSRLQSYSRLYPQFNNYDLNKSLRKIQNNIFSKVSKYNVEIQILKQKCEAMENQIEQIKNHKQQQNMQVQFSNVHKHGQQPLFKQILKAESKLAALRNQKIKRQITNNSFTLNQQLNTQKKNHANLIKTLNNIQNFMSDQNSNYNKQKLNKSEQQLKIKQLQNKLQELELLNNQNKLEFQVKIMEEKLKYSKQSQSVINQKYRQLEERKNQLQKELEQQVENKRQFSQELILFMQSFKKQKLANKQLLEQLTHFDQNQFVFSNDIFSLNFFSQNDINLLKEKGLNQNQLQTIMNQLRNQIKKNKN